MGERPQTSGGAELGGKRLHLEALRILACYCVIFNHTGSSGFFLFSRFPAYSPRFWLYGFLSVFCILCVPMFFACSGALLLPKTESLGTLYRRRVLRMALVLLLFSAVYYVRRSRGAADGMSLRGFLRILYTNLHSGHLWYLYAFIPYLMALPLLRTMAQNMKNRDFLYAVLLWLLFSALLPIAESLLLQGRDTHNSFFNMEWLCSRAVIFPLTGYYLENRMDAARAKKALPYLWGVNLAAIVLTLLLTLRQAGLTGVLDEESSQTFFESFVLINVITVYVTAKCFFHGRQLRPAAARFLCSLGSCTFGIYLLHMMLLEQFVTFGIGDALTRAGVGDMLSCLLLCALVMATCHAITLVLKKIPYLNRVI